MFSLFFKKIGSRPCILALGWSGAVETHEIGGLFVWLLGDIYLWHRSHIDNNSAGAVIVLGQDR